VNLPTLQQNSNQATVAELDRETTYEFRIKADAPGISSDWSDLLTVTTPGFPPFTPFLDVVAASSAGVTLEWSGAQPGTVQFIVQRQSILQGPDGPWVEIFGPTVTNKLVDAAVNAGSTYNYRVRATNTWGSVFSNESVVTVPQPAPPSAPATLTARVASAASIEVDWSEVVGASGYILERRTDDPESWIRIASLPASATSYLDSNVVSGTEYWYRAAATNSIGRSAFSPVASVVLTFTSFACMVSDSFDPGLDPTVWSEILGAAVVNGGTGFSSGKALWFGTNTVRSATTIPLPAAQGSTIEFKLRAGNETVDGDTYWNNSEMGEGILLEYSVDGLAWNYLQSYDTAYPGLSRWTNITVQLPTASPRMQFRWRQMKHSGAGYDTWAIDDVCIRGNQTAPLSAPQFLMATAASSTRVALLWFGSGGASHYIIERQKSGAGWEQIGATGAQQTYFTDTNALPQTIYAYRVKAATTVSQSGYSPVAMATTLSQAEDWLHQNFGSTNVPLAGLGSDGVPNVIRYAFNIDANSPLSVLSEDDNSGIPRIWFDTARQRLCADLVQRKAETQPGITYGFEVSEDLSNWSGVLAPVAVQNLDAIWQRVRYESAIPSGPPVRARFGRVIVRLAP
jgi:hypothetical protein